MPACAPNAPGSSLGSNLGGMITIHARGTLPPHNRLWGRLCTAKPFFEYLTRVPQDELVSLYRQARAVLFPSFAEGFGFAPLEAMQCGTPAVVSDVPAHRWVLRDAVLYADPYDTAAIAQQLSLLLADRNQGGLGCELRAKAAKVLDRFSLSATSQQWLALFDKLRSGSGL
jgi:glycosyltransferase involved in cell wall biosynthesis